MEVGDLMAKLKMQGMDEWENQLLELRDVGVSTIGRAIYQGAKVIADQVKANIQALPIDDRHVKNGQTLHGVKSLEKQGLLEGFGVSRLRDENGYRNVKLGFDGYSPVPSNFSAKGVANIVVARAVNSGNSFRSKIPFVDNAVYAKKAECEKVMQKTFEDAIKKVAR